MPFETQETTTTNFDEIVRIRPQQQINSDDVYYASTTTEGNPIENYRVAQEELRRTGQSTFVEEARKRWTVEQDAQAKETITNLMIDETIPAYQKQAVLSTYISGGYLGKDLRDKYLLKQATIDSGVMEADKRAQDIYAESVYQRDAQKKQQDAAKLIEEAEVDFSSVLKGTAAVAKGIVLSIPAGLVGAYTLIKERDSAKAAEIVQSVQQWGWQPTDAGSQKVVDKIASALEILDIPFKWIGDKTLDITGNPGVATAVYTGTSVAGYIGGFKAARAGVKALKGKPKVESTSPLGTTATANKDNATTLATAAVVDETGQLAGALRTSKESLIADWTLPKLEDEFGEIKPELRQKIQEQDVALSGLYRETEFDPNVAPVSKLLDEREMYLKAVEETNGPKLLLSSSVLDPQILESTVHSLKGKLLFGRNELHGYETKIGAEYALEQMKESTAHLPDQGKFSIVEKPSEGFFVQWDVNRKYNPWEHLTFGGDAIGAHFTVPFTPWKFDITYFANSIVGDKIFPAYMRMKEWVPSAGQAAGWQQVRVENAFIRAQRELFLSTKYGKELATSLRQGDREGKLYTNADIAAQHPHLTKKEVDKLHAEYVGYRRIEDHLYRFADRKFRHDLDSSGYKTLYDYNGNKLGYASKEVAESELVGVDEVWNFNGQKGIPRTPEMEIIRLQQPIHVDGNIYEYAQVTTDFKLGPLLPGSLTKIPGYVGRHYKEYYVVDKVPKEMKVNGKKISSEELRNYKRAIYMAKTQKEAQQLEAKLQENDPNYKYEWRREQKDIADKIILDSHIYDGFFKEKHKRGEQLPSHDGLADIEDPLVAQTKAIMSTSRITSWDQYMDAARTNWVKAYGKFSNHVFPDSINKITPKVRMSPEESREFLAAQKIYQQLEQQQFHSVPSEIIWKSTLNGVAEVFDNMHLPSEILRKWGENGIWPVRAAKALGSNLWLYLRPPRMWVVQPQQIKELVFMEPTFMKEATNILPVFSGLLARTKTLEPLKAGSDAMGKRASPEYDRLLNAIERSGIMQAIDTNQMIHGIWKDAASELDPGTITKIGETLKKGASLPSKIGRAIGYDPAELMNQVTLWLFAKHRFEKTNPGTKWDTSENIAQITQAAGRYGHMASTRAGMYTWQEGTLGVFTQFAAIPFKSLLQMFSAKELTTTDKAKLAAARLFWYGKYGVPYGAAMYAVFSKEADPETQENWDRWTTGVSNHIMNNTLDWMLGESERPSQSEWSKSTSTVPETIWFWDLGMALYDMSTGGDSGKKANFPFLQASDSLYKAVRTIYDLYTIPPLTGDERDYGRIVWEAASFAGVLSDYSKMKIDEYTSKMGQSLGYQQTRGEAISRLFGVPDRESIIQQQLSKSIVAREKDIKSDAKTIYERIHAIKGKHTSSNREDIEEALMFHRQLDAFKQSIEPAYWDEILSEIKTLDKKNQSTKQESILSYYYKHYNKEADSHIMDMKTQLQDSEQPGIKALLKDLEDTQ